MSLLAIANAWGCTKRQLQLWIDGDKTRADRAKEARENAADWADRQAEKILLDLKPGATPSEIAQARELAAHYRWRARVRNPATHGDKITVDHKRTMDPSMMSDAELAFIASGSGITIEGDAEIISPMETLTRPE
jgi:hypothetical protein